MSGTMFMRVEEVAEEMGVSIPYAYKLIRKLNKELAKTGCITILQDELTENSSMKSSTAQSSRMKGENEHGSI